MPISRSASSALQSSLGPYLYELRVGVEIFFATSGFLLYRPFVLAHLSGRPAPPLGSYSRRRFLRIYPAYWVALTVTVFALGIGTFVSFRAAVANYALIQTYDWPRSVGTQGLTIAWTLVIELTFYVTLPLYAFVISRVGIRNRLRTAVVGALLLVAAGIGFSAVWTFGTNPNGPLRYSLLANLSPFGAGMFLAVASADEVVRGRARTWVERLGRFPALWWGFAAVAWSSVIWLVHVPVIPEPGQVPTGRQLFAESVIFSIVGAAMVVPVVLGEQRRGVTRAALRLRPVVYVGVVSYGIYLWHFPLAEKLLERFDLVPATTNFFVITGATFALSLAVATASWFLLERPIVAFARRGFSGRNRPPPPATTARVASTTPEPG